MPARKLPSNEKLIELYRTRSCREIGLLYSATVATVAHHLRILGVIRKPKETHKLPGRHPVIFTREWLNQKYVVEELDCVQIGRIANKDPKTIWYWLKKFDIETRPRGTNYEKNLNKGRPHGWHHTKEAIEKVRKATVESGRVPYLRNGVHHLKGKRGADTPTWKGGVTPERQAFYSSEEWKKAVVIVWKRDNAMCQKCSLDFRKVDRKSMRFHVHHIRSFAIKELRADPNNLALLCEDCHRFVHSKKNINNEFLLGATQ